MNDDKIVLLGDVGQYLLSNEKGVKALAFVDIYI